MSKGGLPLVMTKEILWFSDFFFFHTDDFTARAPYLSESELLGRAYIAGQPGAEPQYQVTTAKVSSNNSQRHSA